MHLMNISNNNRLSFESSIRTLICKEKYLLKIVLLKVRMYLNERCALTVSIPLKISVQE